ncbi:MAG: hypothetical protein IPH41_01930 [Sulfuritalea sp.]|jgi:hypothetical protein|nr:hypothetical protein [Sulfuritalea sp.]
MKKALTPGQVAAAMRFYAIALGPHGKPKPSQIAEIEKAGIPAIGLLPPSNPQPKKDSP